VCSGTFVGVNSSFAPAADAVEDDDSEAGTGTDEMVVGGMQDALQGFELGGKRRDGAEGAVDAVLGLDFGGSLFEALGRGRRGRLLWHWGCRLGGRRATFRNGRGNAAGRRNAAAR
jgi:hypothetical protein